MVSKLSATILLALGVISSPAGAADGGVKNMTTPIDVFEGAPKALQNRTCGELLAGLSMAGLKALGQEGMTFEDLEKDNRVSLVYHTAAASILHFEAAEGLNEEGISAAAKLSRDIEAMSAEEHIKIATQCNQTVVDWLASGEIIRPAYEQALLKAFNTLPVLLDSKKSKELLSQLTQLQ